MMRALGGSSWTLTSNVLTGVTTLTVSVAVQASGGTYWLGQWSVCSSPLLVGLAISRAVASQTVLRGLDWRNIRHYKQSITLLLLLISLASALLVFLFELEPALYSFALISPILILQDHARFIWFGSREPVKSALTDATWLLSSLAGGLVWYVTSGGQLGPLAVVSLYSIGGLLGFIVALPAFRMRGRDDDKHPAVRALMAESLSVFGLGTGSQVVVAAVVSVATVGLVRLATAIVQPVIFLANLAATISGPRMDPHDRRSVMKYSIASGLACFVCGIACCSAVALIPPVARFLKVADQTTQVVQVTVVLTAAQSLGAFLSIYMIRVRIQTRARTWLTARLVGAFCDPITSIPLAVAIGAPGLAAGPLANNVAIGSILLVRKRINSLRKFSSKSMGNVVNQEAKCE